MENKTSSVDKSKRTLLKVSYVAPAILTLAATPSFAGTGSGYQGGGGSSPSRPRFSLRDYIRYLLGRR